MITSHCKLELLRKSHYLLTDPRIKYLLAFNKKSSAPQNNKHNEKIFSNPLVVAKNFFDYFSKIGLILASKISSQDDNAFKTYLGESLFSSLFVCLTTFFEILQKINSLKKQKKNHNLSHMI